MLFLRVVLLQHGLLLPWDTRVFNNWVSACFYDACLSNMSNGCRAESHVVGPCRNARSWKQVSVSWRKLLWNCRVGMLTGPDFSESWWSLTIWSEGLLYVQRAWSCSTCQAVWADTSPPSLSWAQSCWLAVVHITWGIQNTTDLRKGKKKSVNLAECNLWGHLRILARAF